MLEMALILRVTEFVMKSSSKTFSFIESSEFEDYFKLRRVVLSN